MAGHTLPSAIALLTLLLLVSSSAPTAARHVPPTRSRCHLARRRLPPCLDMTTFIHHTLALYNETVAQRTDRLLTLYGGNVDAVVPWNGAGHAETYLWDFFPPTFTCPFRHRLGRLSDGGKVVCNWQTLRDRCALDAGAATVYSFGVRGDVSFEDDLVARTRCAVHAFDHTVAGLPHPVAGTKFAAVGLAAVDTPPLLQSLPTLTAQRGHTRVDLLKIDCEGCEWAVFAALAEAGALASVDQVLIELHFKQAHTNTAGRDSGVRDVFAFFEAMEDAGLYPFSWEVNHNAGASRMYPWVVEYSFVRATSGFMTDVGAWKKESW